MKLYRITKARYAASAWTGEGAERFGGRWNSRGKRAVYVASSISLAQLEILVHVEKADLLESYCCYEMTVPESQLAVLDTASLPANWRDDPAPEEARLIGDQWLASRSSVGLLIPSTVVPQEYNALLNPQHPEHEKIIDQALEIPLQFDPRLSQF